MFNKGDPQKEGRYLILVEATGGDQFRFDKLPGQNIYTYICCGVYQSEMWLLDEAIVFIPNNAIKRVVGWMGLPEVSEAG